MKPSSFEHVAPDTVEGVLAALAEDPEESKILAGGQSLVPVMALRLAAPARLVDINRVPALQGVRVVGDTVEIGACTRHTDVVEARVPGPLGRLLALAAGYIGHLPIRNRGTFGGSIAHCDAAAEWCVVARLLDAEMTAESLAGGRRSIAARDFFLGTFTTALRTDELLTGIRLPLLDERHGVGFSEYARRVGDFGIVIAAAAIATTDGVITDARVCLGGVDPIPFRSGAAEQALLGAEPTDETFRLACEAAAAEVSPPADVHGDADYRRVLVRGLLRRSLVECTADRHGESR